MVPPAPITTSAHATSERLSIARSGTVTPASVR